MRKVFFISILLTAYITQAQTLVYESKIDKEIRAVNYKFLNQTNKFLLALSNKKNAYGIIYNKLQVVGENSKAISLIDNEEFNKFQGSQLGNSFFVCRAKAKLMGANYTYKYFTETSNSGEFEKIPNYSYTAETFFDNQFHLFVASNSGDINPNIEKDEITVTKYNFLKKSTNSFQLKKPDLKRLKTKDLLEIKRVAFQKRMVDENSFEIITKSINKNFQTSTMYRTIYNLDGKVTNEYKYEFNTPKGYFTFIGTPSREENRYFGKQQTEIIEPMYDLDVNDYYIDNYTDNLYIFGVATDEKEKPIGFYVIKFKKTGEKVWEKFFDVTDEKGFSQKSSYWIGKDIKMVEFMDENTLAVSIDGENTYTSRYAQFFLINKNTGELIKKNKVDFNNESSKGTFTSLAKYSVLQITKLSNNRYGNVEVLLAEAFNENVKKYINSVKSSADVFFDAVSTSKGIWLLESDNDSYFKINLFKL